MAPQLAPAGLALLLSWAETKNKTNTAIIEEFGLLSTKHSSHISPAIPVPSPFPGTSTALGYSEEVLQYSDFPPSTAFSSSKCHVHIFSIMTLVKNLCFL